jgi:PAS domain S-box-containing protein
MEGDRDEHRFFEDDIEGKNLLSSLFDHISMGIVYGNNEGKMAYSNAKGREFIDMVEKSRLFQKKLHGLIKKKKNFRSHLMAVNGSYFSLNGIFFQESIYMLLIEDISEKYGVIFDSLATGTVIIRNGKCVFFNKKFHNLVNQKKNYCGNFIDLVCSDDRECLEKEIKKASEGKNCHCEARMKRRGNKEAWVEIYGIPLRNGNEEAVLLNIYDISRRKKIEEELQSTKATLEKILEKERTFVEDVSHYFFNPLCIAKGYIDLSLQNVDSETRRKLKITRDAVNRVETVVKHVVNERQIYE